MRHLATFTLGLATVVVLALLFTQPATGRPESTHRPAQIIPPARWGSGEADPARTKVPTLRPSATPTTSSGAASATAATDPVPTVAPTPKPTRRPRHSLVGTATWYCRPGSSACTKGYRASGLYAAAGPKLRVGAWRGRYVTVTAGGRSVRVRLVDTCACPGERLIDLYATAFQRLAPLSRGVIEVSIR